MKIFRTVKGIQGFLSKQESCDVAFVPTMGALHDGHLSLLDIARDAADICVSSIYVNPTQFNDKEDLIQYPRTFEKDVEKLLKRKADVLFYPSDKEVYPAGLKTAVDINLNGLGDIMEGEFRPGHFNGMMEVVHRLLQIVKPDYIVMGQKDIQQARIVTQMLRQLLPDIELILAPIQRDLDGLALSSRNKRLKPEIRDKAAILYKTLLWAREAINNYSIQYIEDQAIKQLSIKDFRPEYFKIVNAETLQPVMKVEEQTELMACTAVWAGEIRLIDNMFLS